MNNIITDIKALQEETLLNLQSSKAIDNTVRAYKSDFNDFGLFCASKWFQIWLPSEPKDVVSEEGVIFNSFINLKHAKMSTLKR